MIKTTVLQFMLEGQYNQNDRNSFERCALSGAQKHITKESDGFHNHSTQLAMFTPSKNKDQNR